MKRQKDEPKLVGAKEAAEILGVLQVNLRVVKGLPEPYSKVGATTLWREDEIRALKRRRTAVKRSRARKAAA